MKKARFFIPAFIFYLLIFLLSSQDLGVPLPGRGFDKVAHFAEFSLLGFLLSVGYFNAFRFSPAAKTVLVLLTGLPLGVLDEIHQLFVPGRSSDVRDAVADSAGIICGILVYLFLARRRRRARKIPAA